MHSGPSPARSRCLHPRHPTSFLISNRRMNILLVALSLISVPMCIVCSDSTSSDGPHTQVQSSRKYYGAPFWIQDSTIILTHTPLDENGIGISALSGVYSIALNRQELSPVFTFEEVGFYLDLNDYSNITSNGLATANGQLFEIEFGERRVRQLTFGPPNTKLFPTWGPAPDLIAFVVEGSSPFAERGLYRDYGVTSGSALWKNFDSTGPNLIMPDWSPLGSQLVGVRYVAGKGFCRLVTFDTTSFVLQDIFSSEVEINDPRYSPDGGSVVFWTSPTEMGDPIIWVIRTDGTDLRQLTVDGGIKPNWSPKGTQIVYIRQTWNVERIGADNGSVWTMNSDGGGKVQVVN